MQLQQGPTGRNPIARGVSPWNRFPIEQKPQGGDTLVSPPWGFIRAICSPGAYAPGYVLSPRCGSTIARRLDIIARTRPTRLRGYGTRGVPATLWKRGDGGSRGLDPRY